MDTFIFQSIIKTDYRATLTIFNQKLGIACRPISREIFYSKIYIKNLLANWLTRMIGRISVNLLTKSLKNCSLKNCMSVLKKNVITIRTKRIIKTTKQLHSTEKLRHAESRTHVKCRDVYFFSKKIPKAMASIIKNRILGI